MEKTERNMNWPLLICAVSTSIALFILFINMILGDEYSMENGVIITAAVAIVVALIGVASGVWIQIIQFKKDSNTIGSVKADTSEIKPKTTEIREDVKEIRSDVIRTVVPGMKTVEQSVQSINSLMDELKYQKRIKEEVSSNIGSKDYLLNGIETVYEVNAGLMNQVKELQKENYLCKQQIVTLTKENEILREKTRQQQKSPYHQRDFGLDR